MPYPWVGVTEEEARVLKELEIFMRRERVMNPVGKNQCSMDV